MCDVDNPQDGNHGEPNQHDGSEHPSNRCRSKLLHKKQYRNNSQNNVNDLHFGDGSKTGKLGKSFNGRGHGYGRCNHPISQQCSTTNHGRCYQPLSSPPDKGIEREDATLTPVVGLERQNHIFHRCLQCQRPDDTRDSSQYKVFTDNTSIDDCTENVKRGCSDVSVNDPQGDQ